MIILGSRALNENLKQENDFSFEERANKADFDVIISYDDFMEFLEKNKEHIKKIKPVSEYKYRAKLTLDNVNYNYEIELDILPSQEFLLNKYQSKEDNLLLSDPFGNEFIVPDNEDLFLTKKSHINRNIHYEKSMKDYHFLKSKLKVSIDELMSDKVRKKYYKLRNKEVLERSLKKKEPSLKRGTTDFFERSKKAVGYIFIHDDIHESIKKYETPIYKMMQRDENSAWCEKDMWEKLPHNIKIRCVQEEAYVIALERYIILQKGNFEDPKVSYNDALNRICTTLCSGWFREFAVNNYYEVLDAYDTKFIKDFCSNIKSGHVRVHDHIETDLFENTKNWLFEYDKKHSKQNELKTKPKIKLK